ncbi:MAG: amidohydrolase family protein [Gaiellaceae bacterium]
MPARGELPPTLAAAFETDELIPIVDTHQHLIYPGLLPYPWTAGIPMLEDRAFRREDYLAAAAGSGIAATIFMEATTVDPAEHDELAFVGSLSPDPDPAIVGIVAACRPERPGFAAFLDALRGARVVGLRRVLHCEPDELSRAQLFRENLRRLPDYALSFDLCVLVRQLPLAIELVDACPSVSFVLDHCGNPDIASGGVEPWRTHLAEIASRPNLVCKLSGLLNRCDPEAATLEAVRPYAEHAIESFGWERVVWGSDWPVVNLTSSLRHWVEISRNLVAGEHARRARALFRDNAVRVYGLEPAAVP